MNQVSTEQLDALVQQFGPRRREAFSALKPHNDLIEGLRRRGASFYTIHQVLRAQGVQTCPTMIREYCRKVFGEPRQRTTRKGRTANLKSALPSQTPIAPKVGLPAVAVIHSDPTTPHRERSTGPHVAKVEFIEEPKI